PEVGLVEWKLPLAFGPEAHHFLPERPCSSRAGRVRICKAGFAMTGRGVWRQTGNALAPTSPIRACSTRHSLSQVTSFQNLPPFCCSASDYWDWELGGGSTFSNTSESRLILGGFSRRVGQ